MSNYRCIYKYVCVCVCGCVLDLFITSGLAHSRKATTNKNILHSFIVRINNALYNNVL